MNQTDCQTIYADAMEAMRCLRLACAAVRESLEIFETKKQKSEEEKNIEDTLDGVSETLQENLHTMLNITQKVNGLMD